jgi:hypothetical protein
MSSALTPTAHGIDPVPPPLGEERFSYNPGCQIGDLPISPAALGAF